MVKLWCVMLKTFCVKRGYWCYYLLWEVIFDNCLNCSGCVAPTIWSIYADSPIHGVLYGLVRFLQFTSHPLLAWSLPLLQPQTLLSHINTNCEKQGRTTHWIQYVVCSYWVTYAHRETSWLLLCREVMLCFVYLLLSWRNAGLICE